MQTFKTFCLFILTLLVFLLLLQFFSSCTQTKLLQHLKEQHPNCRIAIVDETPQQIEIVVVCPNKTPIIRTYTKK